jgi:hypothetical protein
MNSVLEGAGIATSNGLDGWSCFHQGQDIVVNSTAARPTLGPTCLPIQWVPGVKQMQRSGMVELYSHSLIHFHGFVLIELSTGTLYLSL